MLQLVKLLQAEFESASLSTENLSADRRQAGALQAQGSQAPSVPPLPKAPPVKAPVPGSPEEAVKAMDAGGDAKGKGKSKGKGKDEGEGKMCYSFSEAKGCRYGDACKFKHDRATAKG